MSLDVKKLDDEFGQYGLRATCGACGHVRKIAPSQLAKLFGWSARLTTIAARMRCSKCQARRCELEAIPRQKPRKLHDPRN